MASKNNQVAIVDSGNKQVESESTEETTLTEVSFSCKSNKKFPENIRIEHSRITQHSSEDLYNCFINISDSFLDFEPAIEKIFTFSFDKNSEV